MNIFYSFVKKTTNIKTGPLSILTSSYITCPDACPFKKNGCYADAGPLRIHWVKTSDGQRGMRFGEILDVLEEEADGSLIRLFQAGDMPGRNNYIHKNNTIRLIKSLHNWKAFGYTHKPVYFRDNAEIIKLCNESGVCINLSANNPKHADELYKLDIGPVATTVDLQSPKTTPEGVRIKICPAVTGRVQCISCGGKNGPICSWIDRDFIVGFPVHGTFKNKAKEVVNGY